MSGTTELRAPFADYLGIKIKHISPERVEAELLFATSCNHPRNLHGGAIMALADGLRTPP